MAIKLSLGRDQNKAFAVFPAAYIRIANVSTNNQGQTILSIQGFADAEAYAKAKTSTGINSPMSGQASTVYEKSITADKLPAAPTTGTYATLQDQQKTAGYLYLKTLSEFSAGEDC